MAACTCTRINTLATLPRISASYASFSLKTSSSCLVIFGFSGAFFLLAPSSLARSPYILRSSLLTCRVSFASSRTCLSAACHCLFKDISNTCAFKRQQARARACVSAYLRT